MQSELIGKIPADTDSLMFLVVIPQCNSMEMNYLSTVWLHMSVGGQLFKRAGGEGFFYLLANHEFLSTETNFQHSQFMYSWLPTMCIIHDPHSERKLSEDCSEAY